MSEISSDTGLLFCRKPCMTILCLQIGKARQGDLISVREDGSSDAGTAEDLTGRETMIKTPMLVGSTVVEGLAWEFSIGQDFSRGRGWVETLEFSRKVLEYRTLVN